MPVNDQTPDVMLYDSNGVEMAVANGVAIPVGTRGLLSVGSDGANARFLLVDASGRQIAVGAAASGAVPAGNPALVAGSDGAAVRTLLTDTTGRLYVLQTQDERATWSAIATGISVANNKSMISILNATGTVVVVRLREIWVENTQVTSNTGIVGRFEVHRMTGHSAGTLITPLSYDTADALDVNVTVRTGATIAGEVAGILWQKIWSTDQKQGPRGGIGVGNSAGTLVDHTQQALTPFWSRKDLLERAFTLRSNQGFTVKFATNSTSGTFDLTLVFTQAST